MYRINSWIEPGSACNSESIRSDSTASLYADIPCRVCISRSPYAEEEAWSPNNRKIATSMLFEEILLVTTLLSMINRARGL